VRPTFSPDWRKDFGWHAVLGALLIPVLHLVPVVFPRSDPQISTALIGFAVWGIAFGIAMGAAVRANTAVAWEREKGTLEALMLTGLGCREILRQKWRGSYGVLGGLYGVMLGAMAAGLLSASLHPLAAAVILVTTPPLVAFAASVGLYFSVGARSVAVAGRNMFLAVTTIVVVVMTVVGVVLGVLSMWLGLEPDRGTALVATTLLPQAGTGFLTFAPLTGPRGRLPVLGEMAAGAVVGTLVYAWLAGVLWRAAVRRFEREWEVRE
jgi:hypothetical protein